MELKIFEFLKCLLIAVAIPQFIQVNVLEIIDFVYGLKV